jgi:hypothetical protein
MGGFNNYNACKNTFLLISNCHSDHPFSKLFQVLTSIYLLCLSLSLSFQEIFRNTDSLHDQFFIEYLLSTVKS